MKMNKKGFTLAELLIVIAIIAILIAIAIPAFGSALDNARLQTDHANMRSAYAIAQVANLQGFIEVDGTVYTTNPASGQEDIESLAAYFGADGDVTATKGDAYTTAIKPSDAAKCKASAFCQEITHEKDKVIAFTYDTAKGVVLSLAS